MKAMALRSIEVAAYGAAQQPTRNERIIDLRKSGVGPREIARRLSLSPNVVAGVLHRAGLTDPKASSCCGGCKGGGGSEPGYRAWAVGLLATNTASQAAAKASVSARTLFAWRRQIEAAA